MARQSCVFDRRLGARTATTDRLPTPEGSWPLATHSCSQPTLTECPPALRCLKLPRRYASCGQTTYLNSKIMLVARHTLVSCARGVGGCGGGVRAPVQPAYYVVSRMPMLAVCRDAMQSVVAVAWPAQLVSSGIGAALNHGRIGSIGRRRVTTEAALQRPVRRTERDWLGSLSHCTPSHARTLRVRSRTAG